MPTNAEIRQKAREALGGHPFTAEWLIGALIVLFLAGLAILLNAVFPPLLLLLLPLHVGLYDYFFRRVRGYYTSFSTLFGGYSCFRDSFVLGFLIRLFVSLWSLLFWIPGIIKSHAYSMAYFISIDHPEYTPSQAIAESEFMMEGYKFDLFRLRLSLIGWYLLGLVTVVGLPFVDTYHYAAEAAFYDELKAFQSGQVVSEQSEDLPIE